MDDNRKWHLAWAKLGAFSKDLPQYIEEKHVKEFHATLDLFHEATTEDVSPFKIPGEELKPRVTRAKMGSDFTGRPGRVTYSDEKYCDRNLMVRRISEVRNYFTSIFPAPDRPKMGF